MPNKDIDYYKSDTDYLRDLLKRLDLLIHRQVLVSRSKGDGEDPLHGLYISDEMVNSLLEQGALRHQGSDVVKVEQRLESLNAEIKRKRKNSIEKGVRLNSFYLSRNFHLKNFEADAILICAAPDIDSKYEKLYAYLQDDIGKKRPSVGLILDLLCSSSEEKITARQFFLPQGKLFRERLIEVENEGQDGERLSTTVRLSSSLLGLLLGLEKIDPELVDSKLAAGSGKCEGCNLILPEDLQGKIANLVGYFRHENGVRICCLQGPYGSGKEEIAEQICRMLGIDLLKLDLSSPIVPDAGNLKDFVARHFLNASLKGAAVYLDHFEALSSEELKSHSLKELILNELNSFSGVALISSQKDADLAGLEHKGIFHIRIDPPDYESRRSIWEKYLKSEVDTDIPIGDPSAPAPQDMGRSEGVTRELVIERICGVDLMDDIWDDGYHPAEVVRANFGNVILDEMEGVLQRQKPSEDLTEDSLADDLANKFRFTPGQVRDAYRAALNLAILNGRRSPSAEDLYEGCKAQSNRKLATLARQIEPRHRWESLILPDEKLRQLREISNNIKHKSTVFEDWGFEERLSMGKGLNILFYGSSGTGKTMAAEVLASQLNLELYKIDLSLIVSKYIGETEKNLGRIFKEAEQSNAILLFDEADALFGKRSEVKDAHDRYANVEISYLLQKMEEHEGIVILATNLQENMDDAFLRRMSFTIEFPFPEEEHRMKLWKSLLPEKAPIEDDIDFEFLARKFKVAGGNIKNIVVGAAFLAAEDSRPIGMEHLLKATKSELLKMEKVCTESDFGKYYELVRDY